MSSRKTKLPDFEQSMQELEKLVDQLERGDLPLEEALKQFERGVALTRACQSALKEAEQKVEILLKGATAAGETMPEADRVPDAGNVPDADRQGTVAVTATSVTITDFEPES